ncbi:MAG: FkbM family methyltransferase [Planctomycetia bacterium]|nr:FkbM family methyltransferase [Planctomycetia bacterium]
MKTILRDVVGLLRVCGPLVAGCWLVALVGNLCQILRSRNLQAADRSVGCGPFAIRYPTASTRFVVTGEGVLSGVREMYVRDCYLRHGTLAIHDGDMVVDLGANVGNFTNLALAHGEAIRVVALEPSRALNEAFEKSVAKNPGFRSRVTLVRGFIGEPCDKQLALTRDDPNYRDAKWLAEAEFLAQARISRVDFLKCDIEGGEFSALGPGSRLVDMVQSLAVEIHAFAGDVESLVSSLCDRGLIPRHRDNHPDGSCILLASRASPGEAAAGGHDRCP